MPAQVVLLLLLAAAMALYLIVDGVRGRKKLLRRLRKNFGAVPDSTYRRASLDHYWREYQAAHPQEESVDDLTWDDLDLEAVFERVNACLTLIGEDYLYALLHRQLGEEALREREKLLGLLEEEPLRLRVQTALARLGKRTGTDLAEVLFHPETFALGGKARFWCAALAPLAALPLFLFYPPLAGLWLLLTLGHNLWLYLGTQKKLEGRLETVSYLTAALRCGRSLQKELKGRSPGLAAQLGQAAVLGKKLGGGAVLLSPSPQSDAYMLVQVLGMVTLFPILQYQRTARVLEQSQRELCRFFELLGELDASLAILSYRHSLDAYVQPHFLPGLEVRFKGLRHPLLTETGCVPNDAAIVKNWLLTGSNASGKSTFIKAVALNLILAQNIFTCTAEQFELGRALVVTSMAARDDVTAGESYFVAEIKSMRRVVARAERGEAFYCFIDEVLKGTNTAERIAASGAVLRYLCAPGCRCVAATHDLELTGLLVAAYENHHFSEQVGPEGVSFDYKLKDGPCRTRNAIRLLDHYRFPAGLVADARAAVEADETARGGPAAPIRKRGVEMP